MANSKRPTRQRPQATGHGNLKTLARNSAQGFGVNADADFNCGDRHRTCGRVFDKQFDRAAFSPGIDSGMHCVGKHLVPCMYLCQAFAENQAESGFQAHQQIHGGCAAELAIAQAVLPACPVPVKTRCRVAACHLHCQRIHRHKSQAGRHHQAFL